MRLKPGVNLVGIKEEAVVGMQIAESVYRKHGVELVVTCVTDGHHGRGSLHYTGYAFDTRINGIPRNKIEYIYSDLHESLGAEFDVVLEQDHIHIEFQPKKGVNL